MKRVLRAAAVGVMLTTISIPAAGDSRKDDHRLREITAAYGTCVVRKHHAKASEAILGTASNNEINGRMSQVIDADCLGEAAGYGVDMRFPNDTYRYALADALVRADFATHGDTSFADRLPLAQYSFIDDGARQISLSKAKTGKARTEVQRSIDKTNSLVWLSRYGECIARKDPSNARYWLLTPADSPEETSRIKVMQPAFSDCLGQGTMHFNRIAIRGTVAVSYYRLAMATAVPAGRSNP